MAPSAEFTTAAERVKTLKKNPSNDEKLELYGLYKVGMGEDITKASKPGTFDLAGKAKQTAWKGVVDEGTTAEEAQKRYIAVVERLVNKYGIE